MRRSYKNLPAGDLRLKLNRMREERAREGKDVPPEPYYNYHRDPVRDGEEQCSSNRPAYRGRAVRMRGRGRGKNTILNELNTGSPMKITVELKDDGSRTCTLNEDETFDFPAARGHTSRGRGRSSHMKIAVDDGSRTCTLNEEETFDFPAARGHYGRGRGRGWYVRRRGGGEGENRDDVYYSRGRRGRSYRARFNYRGRGGRGRGRGAVHASENLGDASDNLGDIVLPSSQEEHFEEHVPENSTNLLEEEQWEDNYTAVEGAVAAEGDEDFYHDEEYHYDDFYPCEGAEQTGESLQDELNEAQQKEANLENESTVKNEEELSKDELSKDKGNTSIKKESPREEGENSRGKDDKLAKNDSRLATRKEKAKVDPNNEVKKVDKKHESSKTATKKESEPIKRLEGKKVDRNHEVKKVDEKHESSEKES